jgi:hypothetical protein
MKAVIFAAALAAAVPLALAHAAGPFDGQYAGGSPAMRGTCPATTATVSIVDGKISGTSKVSAYTFSITGTVAPDGTVTGKWATYPFSGKIVGGRLTGSYNSKECKAERPVTLDKTG